MIEMPCDYATNIGYRNGIWVEDLGRTPELYLDRCRPHEWPRDMSTQETGCYKHTSRQDCTSPEKNLEGVTCRWNEPCYYDLEACYDPREIPADVCTKLFPNSGVDLVHSVRDTCHHNFLWLDRGVNLRCHQNKDTTFTPPHHSFFPVPWGTG